MGRVRYDKQRYSYPCSMLLVTINCATKAYNRLVRIYCIKLKLVARFESWLPLTKLLDEQRKLTKHQRHRLRLHCTNADQPIGGQCHVLCLMMEIQLVIWARVVRKNIFYCNMLTHLQTNYLPKHQLERDKIAIYSIHISKINRSGEFSFSQS